MVVAVPTFFAAFQSQNRANYKGFPTPSRALERRKIMAIHVAQRQKNWLGIAVCVWSALAAPVWGQDDAHSSGKNGKNIFEYTAPGGGVSKKLMDSIGVDQKLNSRLPLNLEFKDETGKTVTLGQYYGKKPVVLTMLQMTCDQVCSAQLEVMTGGLNALPFSAGKEFEVLTVSIDPKESPLIAQDVKDEYLKQYQRPGAQKGWHFLTGSEKNIKALAQSVGYRYAWDEKSKQYVHPDTLMMTTPDGRISKYFMSLRYGPSQAQDLKFALMEASHERIGTIVDAAVLSCFHYNPVTGKYSFQIMSFLRFVGATFVLGCLAAIAWNVISEKRGRGSNSSKVGGPQLKKA